MQYFPIYFVPFVLDCFKWHTDLYTSLTDIKERALALAHLFCAMLLQHSSLVIGGIICVNHFRQLLAATDTAKKCCLSHSGKFH